MLNSFNYINYFY